MSFIRLAGAHGAGPDVATQARSAMEHLRASLRGCGSDTDHIFDVTIYLLDMGDLLPAAQACRPYLTRQIPTTVVSVERLATPEQLIEITVLAVYPSQDENSGS